MRPATDEIGRDGRRYDASYGITLFYSLQYLRAHRPLGVMILDGGQKL